jgi:hypothetical protein
MELYEFIAQQRQLLDDFAADYERKRKRLRLTMIRPVEQWREEYGNFKEIYDDTKSENYQCERDRIEGGPGSSIRTGTG